MGLTGAWAVPAHACSPVVDVNASPREKSRDAKRAIDQAYAIIDGEVVRPGAVGDTAALIYAHRVLKGPRQAWFEIGSNGNDSCAFTFERTGERNRMYVVKTPNGLAVISPFVDDDYLDRLLKSDRKKDYPYYPGPRPLAATGNNRSNP